MRKDLEEINIQHESTMLRLRFNIFKNCKKGVYDLLILKIIKNNIKTYTTHVLKNHYDFSLKKKHQDAIGEMSEQIDQLNKLKAR